MVQQLIIATTQLCLDLVTFVLNKQIFKQLDTLFSSSTLVCIYCITYRDARDLNTEKTQSAAENHYTLSNEVADTYYEQEEFEKGLQS